MQFFRALAYTATFLALSACLRTELSPKPVPSSVYSLAAANQNPLILKISSSELDESLGHQYLLVGLPYGQVQSKDLESLVQKALYPKLALRGFTPVVDPPEQNAFSKNAPVLEVDIKNAQASAFDLLVTRRLSCSLELQAELNRSSIPRQAQAQGDFEHFGAFGFEQELSLCFSRAMESALDNMLGELRL